MSLTMSCRLEIFDKDGPDPGHPGSLRLDLRGDVSGALADLVQRYASAGADHVLLSLESGDVAAHRALLAAIGPGA
jgi:hypothetical protein